LSDFELSDELLDWEFWLAVLELSEASGLLDAPGPRTLPTAPFTESTTLPMASFTLPRAGIFGVEVPVPVPIPASVLPPGLKSFDGVVTLIFGPLSIGLRSTLGAGGPGLMAAEDVSGEDGVMAGSDSTTGIFGVAVGTWVGVVSGTGVGATAGT
jgi:hypothetical protein